MIEKDNKPQSLKDVMALEDEIQDWQSNMNARNGGLLDQIAKAEAAGNRDLAFELEQERLSVVRVIRGGYSKANESDLGKEALEYVRERRKYIETYIANLLEKKKKD